MSAFPQVDAYLDTRCLPKGGESHYKRSGYPTDLLVPPMRHVGVTDPTSLLLQLILPNATSRTMRRRGSRIDGSRELDHRCSGNPPEQISLSRRSTARKHRVGQLARGCVASSSRTSFAVPDPTTTEPPDTDTPRISSGKPKDSSCRYGQIMAAKRDWYTPELLPRNWTKRSGDHLWLVEAGREDDRARKAGDDRRQLDVVGGWVLSSHGRPLNSWMSRPIWTRHLSSGWTERGS
jgi:hypothetical protein